MTLMETAQLLGNFGEFFGAIAVVATLIYLALHIRQNTHQVRRVEMNAAYAQFSVPRMAIASDRSLAEVAIQVDDGGEGPVDDDWCTVFLPQTRFDLVALCGGRTAVALSAFRG